MLILNNLSDLFFLMQSLDGQNIYTGCCQLKIDYSKLSNLNVKYNNDKSRDFTRPDLPSGLPPPEAQQQISLEAMNLGGKNARTCQQLLLLLNQFEFEATKTFRNFHIFYCLHFNLKEITKN